MSAVCLSVLRGPGTSVFDGKGSLEELSLLIFAGDFVLEMEGVAEQPEAATRVSGEQSLGLLMALLE